MVVFPLYPSYITDRRLNLSTPIMFITHVLASLFTALVGCLSVESIPLFVSLLDVTLAYLETSSCRQVFWTFDKCEAAYQAVDAKFQDIYGRYLNRFHRSKFVYINQPKESVPKDGPDFHPSRVRMLEASWPSDDTNVAFQPVDLTLRGFTYRLLFWLCSPHRAGYHAFHLMIFSLWWRRTISFTCFSLLSATLCAVSTALVPANKTVSEDSLGLGKVTQQNQDA
ncbi:ribosomal protein S23a [Perkinsela sp. CCAP 1560/4]|nr:ribosomal protein S23a [Perkinsela sp. CCAP 1560/4]|eukprot:KNH06817.1 ribosomal protein S23a [Perkinsela sp. CCAP 1560/4]